MTADLYLSRLETSSSRLFAPLALGDGALACTGLGGATAIATLDFQRGPRPSGHAWPRALRSAPDSRGRGGCGAGTVTALARGLAGMCQAGRWERSAGQARGRRPASLPAAIGGQVSVYRGGSCERPWNCLRGRHPGDMETYGLYYGTSIRIAA
jgi:hypothetical protein